MAPLGYQPAHHMLDSSKAAPGLDLNLKQAVLLRKSVYSLKTLGTHKALLGEKRSLIMVILKRAISKWIEDIQNGKN